MALLLDIEQQNLCHMKNNNKSLINGLIYYFMERQFYVADAVIFRILAFRQKMTVKLLLRVASLF